MPAVFTCSVVCSNHMRESQATETFVRGTGGIKRAGCGAALLVALLPFAHSQTPAQIPVESFFRNPAIASARLSPDGKLLAAVAATPAGRTQLVVFDVGVWDKVRFVAGYSDADIRTFRWVNDRRLVFSLIDLSSAGGEQFFASGLYAVDSDGSNLRQLAERAPLARAPSQLVARFLPWSTFLQTVLRDGSDDIVVSEYVAEDKQLKNLRLLRVNTRTGVATHITQGRPSDSVKFVVDRKGEPRWVTASQQGRAHVFKRSASGSSWDLVADYDAYAAEGWEPTSIAPDGTLFVTAPDERGLNALYRFDVATGAPEAKPLVRLADFDFTGDLIIDAETNDVLGVRYRSDGPATTWFNSAMRALQERIDVALPNLANTIVCDRCLNAPNLLIFSQSDTEPGAYSIYNRQKAAVERIASTRPWINAKQMARRDLIRVKARDGLSIPVWITTPQVRDDKRKPPAVVLVHGGPFLRGGDLIWERDAQFLASRGYVVIEPEFRGSTGFGAKHFRAGWKQWGLRMQDDLVDAANALGEQGAIDKERVCIVGASYGGYAALMGVLRDPQTFRCAVAWAAATDIDLLYSIDWSDMSDAWKKYGMPRLVGDRNADAAQLAATSPLRLASRISRPVLLAHGGSDYRVPLTHGRAMMNALRKAGGDVEWVEYSDEGHGWLLEANNFDFYKRVEKFLALHLGDAK